MHIDSSYRGFQLQGFPCHSDSQCHFLLDYGLLATFLNLNGSVHDNRFDLVQAVRTLQGLGGEYLRVQPLIVP